MAKMGMNMGVAKVYLRFGDPMLLGGGVGLQCGHYESP